jgi:hypothetical protein
LHRLTYGSDSAQPLRRLRISNLIGSLCAELRQERSVLHGGGRHKKRRLRHRRPVLRCRRLSLRGAKQQAGQNQASRQGHDSGPRFSFVMRNHGGTAWLFKPKRIYTLLIF